ncbi:glycosyl transferase family protein [Pseudoblastomonas halimionae]|nr:glycosyl transferase family protein [Alteriqipengyuania halimionae]
MANTAWISWTGDMIGALGVAERELFLFAGFWLVIGSVDELAMDAMWGWLRLRGKAKSGRAPAAPEHLSGPIAVFIPTWREAAVIATTIAQIREAWPQAELRILVGLYPNDPATLVSAAQGAGADPRVRLVIHEREGPTTKADCLNRLYRALEDDEARRDVHYRAVLLQDAEDMVHPAAIGVVDRALDGHALVQLPVCPAHNPRSRYVSGHYADEFAEAHAKAMVVRTAFDVALPSAGVGCAVERGMLERLARQGAEGPFDPDSLTEDYELGFKVKALGGRSTFVRSRDERGRLVATISLFPGDIGAAARQKARWIHGIAFQGWDRIGWNGGWVDRWMMLRDRQGPLAALVLATAYALLIVEALLWLMDASHAPLGSIEPYVQGVVLFLLASLVWRAVCRVAFVRREYGWQQAGYALLRIPVGNVIAIMAGRRALVAYVRTLLGAPIRWDKTAHVGHPALLPTRAAAQ